MCEPGRCSNSCLQCTRSFPIWSLVKSTCHSARCNSIQSRARPRRTCPRICEDGDVADWARNTGNERSGTSSPFPYSHSCSSRTGQLGRLPEWLCVSSVDSARDASIEDAFQGLLRRASSYSQLICRANSGRIAQLCAEGSPWCGRANHGKVHT